MMEDQLPYENEEYLRFNESLDREGPIRIAKTDFDPSFLLYKSDYTLYKQAYQEFLEEEFEKLKFRIYNEYPSCIAYHYRRSEKGEGASDPVKKLFYLKDTWESIIFILYAIVLGEIRRKAIKLNAIQIINTISPNGNPIYKKLNSRLLLTDALKEKIKIVKAIIKHSISNNLGLKCELINEGLLNDLLTLQDIRNDISHHTTLSDDEAKQELKKIIPLFNEMLNKTKFLADCQILCFKSFSEKINCREFCGYSLNTEYKNIDIDNHVQYILGLGQEHLFVKWGNDVFSVSPFLHFKIEKTQAFLCFYKQMKDDKFLFEPTILREKLYFDDLQSRFETEKNEILQLLLP